MTGNEANRRTGRSTRRADEYIQDLFTNGYIEVFDHYWEGKPTNSHEGDIHLFKTILQRIQIEHHGINLEVDRSRMTIKIKDFGT